MINSAADVRIPCIRLVLVYLPVYSLYLLTHLPVYLLPPSLLPSLSIKQHRPKIRPCAYPTYVVLLGIGYRFRSRAAESVAAGTLR